MLSIAPSAHRSMYTHYIQYRRNRGQACILCCSLVDAVSYVLFLLSVTLGTRSRSIQPEHCASAPRAVPGRRHQGRWDVCGGMSGRSIEGVVSQQPPARWEGLHTLVLVHPRRKAASCAKSSPNPSIRPFTNGRKRLIAAPRRTLQKVGGLYRIKGELVLDWSDSSLFAE